MSLKKLNSLMIIAIAAICIASCKKDDDTTSVSPTLDGKLAYYLPEYILPDTRIIMTPSGITHPEDNEVGYYWKVTPTMTKSDTTRYENGLDKNGNPSDGTFTHTFSDTLKTYTVTAYAYATGYTYSSMTKQTTVVKGGIDNSITNIDFSSMSSVNIGGIDYPYVTINGTDWMCRNLSGTSEGAPYRNCKAMDDVLGRFYTYEEALNICPDGWHLPTEAEWIAMAGAIGAEKAETYKTIEGVAAMLMGDAYFNDSKMWEYWPSTGKITNESGLSMIPAGYAMLGLKNESASGNDFVDNSYPQAAFKGCLEYAVFWTADINPEDQEQAYYRYLICDQPDMMIAKGDIKTFGASVRCVRTNE